jgi:hypothetical protein
MEKLMNSNLAGNKCYDNVALLDRMGRHYEGMRMQHNPYYQQEMSLLLYLAEDARHRCIPNDELLDEAEALLKDKLNGKVNDPATSIDFQIEKGYQALRKNDYLGATNFIAKAFLEGAAGNIPVLTQLKLL